MSRQQASIYRSVAGAQAIEARYRALLARWPVPNRQFHVATRMGPTFVIASGPEDAPPVVLLHGSGFNSVSWMGDVAAWAARFRVYAVDVIGHPGLSAPARPPYETSAHADWMTDVLNELGVARAALVGISLGGWLAADFAARHPVRVSGLVLLAPGGIGGELMSMPKLIFTVLPLMLLGDWGRRRAMARMLGPTRMSDTAEGREVQDFTALINRHYRQRTDPLARLDDAALGRLDMPVLLIVGALDPMLDSTETRRRLESTVRDLEVIELPDVGHAVIGQTAPVLAFLGRRIAPG